MSYTFSVVWSEEDREFVGLCEAFPSLSWLGSTEQAAMDGIKRLVGSLTFDPDERAAQKQASRDKDAQDLAEGRKTPEQLREENTLIRADGAKILWDDAPEDGLW
jgi:hypothetical protein